MVHSLLTLLGAYSIVVFPFLYFFISLFDLVRGKGRPLTINRRSISHRRPDIALFEILIQVIVLPQSD